MSDQDSLRSWMGGADDAAGVEAEAALARLRRGMFAASEATVSVGRYRELEEIGRGGMSVVYRGRDEEIGRWVAIKLLHGTSSGQQARLRREARAMARLSHPNVVQVLEVGQHRGETYVAMELVEGRDAAAWLAAEPRRWSEVLEVFLAAGEGLAAAHAEGLVHRDFKPSNVMVGDDGRVRVTDFGLAADVGSALGGDTTPADDEGDRSRDDEDEGLTATGARLGTPRYMAPEQRFGARVDHRADQWSFAASLWESLYARHPFEDERGRLDPSRTVPLRPASERGVPRAVGRALRRALAVEPPARHASMHELLAGLRAAARGRGRRVAAAAGALAVLGAATWWLAGTAEAPRRCDPVEHSASLWGAERQAEVERAFLATELPFAAQAHADVRQRVGAWVSSWDHEYRAVCESTPEPGPDAETEQRLSCLRAELTEVDGLVQAFATADRDVVTRAELATRDLPDHARCSESAARAALPPEVVAAHDERMARVRAQVRAGHYREAASLGEEALPLTTEPVLRAEVLLSLALNRRRSGDFEDAAEPMERAFYDAAAAEDADLATRAAIAVLHLEVARSHHDQAEAWLRHASTWVERVPEAEERARLGRERALAEAELRYEQGRYHESLAIMERVWADCGEDESLDFVPRMLNQMGLVHMQQGSYDEAAHWYRRAMVLEAERSGREHPQVASSLENLGTTAWFQGDYEEAARRYEEVYEIRRATLGPGNPKTANTVMNLGLIDHVRGDYPAAVDKLERSIEMFTASVGREHPSTAQALGNLAVTLSEMGQRERSNAFNRESLEIYEAILGPDHPTVGNALHNLASGLTETGHHEEALAMLERAQVITERANGRDHPLYASGLHNEAVIQRRLGRYADAERSDREALARYEASLGPEHPELAMVLVGLAQNALEDRRWADGIETAERARTLAATSASTRGLAAFYLAQALDGAGQGRERVPELVEEARRELSAAGPNGEENLEDLERWARAHR
ncbi:MAG: serine/threonine protein kinase [Myxococcales bacterium]|nr:serine/threonine protein kinase [Myxococcales bacterium]